MNGKLLLIILFILPSLYAGEAEDYAFRGYKQFQSGNYHNAVTLFNRSLGVAKKQGDINKQTVILYNIIQLEIYAQNFPKADSLIGFVETNAPRDLFLESLKAQLATYQGNCPDISKLLNQYSKEDKIRNDYLLYLSQCYLTHDKNKFKSTIKKVDSDFHDSGLYLYTQALNFFNKGLHSKALTAFNNSLEKAQLYNQFYYIGYSLYFIAQCYQHIGNDEKSKIYHKRASEVFQRLGLKTQFIKLQKILED